MAGSGARPPAGSVGPSSDAPELTRQEGLKGLRLVAHSAQMPFLAYLINVALEEANGEKANRG